MKKQKHLGLIGLAISLGINGSAEANLIGLTKQFPNVDLDNSYLIYDHDGIEYQANGNTYHQGLLTVVSFGSTLGESNAEGGSSLTQSYTTYGSDMTPDVMLTIGIRSSTGDWFATPTNPNDPDYATFANVNKVTIGFGNSVDPNGPGNTPGFSWQGNINGFGWQEESVNNGFTSGYGSAFDATWRIKSDDYEDMPANMSQFVDNVLRDSMIGINGGIKITNWAPFVDGTGIAGFYYDYNGNGKFDPNLDITTGHGRKKTTEYDVERVAHPTAFQRDWVFGTSAPDPNLQTLLAPYLTSLSGTMCSSNTETNCLSYINSTVFADVFVPIPPAFWLWAGALTTLIPSARRIKNKNAFA